MENQPAAESQPQPIPSQPAQTAGAPTNKVSPWVWVISGCLLIIFLGFAVMAFLGWMGYRAAKDAIKEQAPAMEEFKGRMDELNKNADQWSQEADKMQKKSREIQESLPAPTDKTSSLPAQE
jgi:hypothetical protein